MRARRQAATPPAPAANRRTDPESGVVSLRLEDIHANYGAEEVIRGLSLSIGPGERVGLVGLNGSGKTTLLRVVAGNLSPSRGRLSWGRTELEAGAAWTRLRNGIISIAQDRPLFSAMSVKDNLRVAALAASRTVAEVVAEAERWLPNVRVRLHAAAQELSGGEQRRLALAMALVCRPRMLVMDEPSVGLDPSACHQLFHEVCATLAAAQVSMFVAEHNVPGLCDLATRICHLADGRLVDCWQRPFSPSMIAARLADERANGSAGR